VLHSSIVSSSQGLGQSLLHCRCNVPRRHSQRCAFVVRPSHRTTCWRFSRSLVAIFSITSSSILWSWDKERRCLPLLFGESKWREGVSCEIFTPTFSPLLVKIDLRTSRTSNFQTRGWKMFRPKAPPHGRRQNYLG
jgi:hypothetical protein